jgi:hypothetical protein
VRYGKQGGFLAQNAKRRQKARKLQTCGKRMVTATTFLCNIRIEIYKRMRDEWRCDLLELPTVSGSMERWKDTHKKDSWKLVRRGTILSGTSTIYGQWIRMSVPRDKTN